MQKNKPDFIQRIYAAPAVEIIEIRTLNVIAASDVSSNSPEPWLEGELDWLND